MASFLQLFRQTATRLLSQGSESLPNHLLLAQCQVLLLEIYYDFSCQDLPPDLEDTQEEFFAPDQGWFQKFLAWDPPGLWGDGSFLDGEVSFYWPCVCLLDLNNFQTDDTSPSVISEIKTRILEIVEVRSPNWPVPSQVIIFTVSQLYIKMYPEQLQKTSAVEYFVKGVWVLMGSSKMTRVTNDTVCLNMHLYE
jgi:exportin-2 (importin alpha re-exporter)